MKRVRAVLIPALALAVFWPFFWWISTTPNNVIQQSPRILRDIGYFSIPMICLNTASGLLGLRRLRPLRQEWGKSKTYRLAAVLCVLHIAAGGLLMGIFLLVFIRAVFFGMGP